MTKRILSTSGKRYLVKAKKKPVAVKPTLEEIKTADSELELPTLRDFDFFMPGQEDIMSANREEHNLNQNLNWEMIWDIMGRNFYGPYYGYCCKHEPNSKQDYLIYDKVKCQDGLIRELVHCYNWWGKRGYRQMKVYQYEGFILYKDMSQQHADMDSLILHRT